MTIEAGFGFLALLSFVDQQSSLPSRRDDRALRCVSPVVALLRHREATQSFPLLMLEAVTTDLVSPSAWSAAPKIFSYPQAGRSITPSSGVKRSCHKHRLRSEA